MGPEVTAGYKQSCLILLLINLPFRRLTMIALSKFDSIMRKSQEGPDVFLTSFFFQFPT